LTGIYRIKNVENGKCYYGSSINLDIRGKQHFRKLREGSHSNPILQRSWNKYGEDSFVYEVIVILERDCLLETETKFISIGEYNISKNAKSPSLGLKRSPETRRKMSEAAKKRGVSPATLEALHKGRAEKLLQEPKISREEQYRRHNEKRRQTPEQNREGLARIAEANRNRKVNPETRLKMSEAARKAWAERAR